MEQVKIDEIRRVVRENYGQVAEAGGSGCGGTPSSCCGTGSDATAESISVALGYSEDEVSSVPPGANMGLGCGNPQAIASLQVSETVLGLGSGGGFDCLLATRAIGDKGLVIGVDMTPEMISKSRENAEKSGLANIEFRLGEIENLPVANDTVDVIISNCVINLSPAKENVFSEAFWVLRPGERLAISDIVVTAELPPSIKQDMALYTECMAGASSIVELESILSHVGFVYFESCRL
jgi:arsenite methyltransferase